jgi:hypothetical protein
VMDDVEAAGRAIEVGSNFFLFFSSESAHMHAHASGGTTQPQASGGGALATDQQNPRHGGDHGGEAGKVATKE